LLLFLKRLHEPKNSACGARDEQKQGPVRNAGSHHPACARPEGSVVIESQYQQNDPYDENDNAYSVILHCKPPF
jgi:hypothetical protein